MRISSILQRKRVLKLEKKQNKEIADDIVKERADDIVKERADDIVLEGIGDEPVPFPMQEQGGTHPEYAGKFSGGNLLFSLKGYRRRMCHDKNYIILCVNIIINNQLYRLCPIFCTVN